MLNRPQSTVYFLRAIEFEDDMVMHARSMHLAYAIIVVIIISSSSSSILYYWQFSYNYCVLLPILATSLLFVANPTVQ